MESPWVRLRSATLHPFLYERMVGEADESASAGDIVAVYDKAGQFFGRGLYNPRSQIVLRMLSHGDGAIDDAFWRARLTRAIELRRMARLDDVTDAYRLVHAEGDGLSGLVIERYADLLVFELFALGMFQRMDLLAGHVTTALGAPTSLDRPHRASPTWRVHFRADERVESMEGFRLPAPRDPTPPTTVIREHGIRYRVDAASGHKTGFFCDQRDNRRRLAAFCRDATVLDLCCYTGGFSLCAKQLGGAREVTAVDLDEAAVAMARENANLNQSRVNVVHSDAFIYLRQLASNARQFDVVVLDPPKFATSRDALEDALRRYYDLNALAAGVVRPGGLLVTCSCSGLVSRSTFVETVHRAARRAGRPAQLIDLTGAAVDHPVALDCPESAYLKVAWLRL